MKFLYTKKCTPVKWILYQKKNSLDFDMWVTTEIKLLNFIGRCNYISPSVRQHKNMYKHNGSMKSSDMCISIIPRNNFDKILQFRERKRETVNYEHIIIIPLKPCSWFITFSGEAGEGLQASTSGGIGALSRPICSIVSTFSVRNPRTSSVVFSDHSVQANRFYFPSDIVYYVSFSWSRYIMFPNWLSVSVETFSYCLILLALAYVCIYGIHPLLCMMWLSVILAQYYLLFLRIIWKSCIEEETCNKI